MWKWIPNGLTLGNLSLGFLSILVASQQQPSAIDPVLLAGLLILVASFLDGLDGATARLLKAQSALGEQLDSLADMVTFGVAPGYLMYKLYLADMVLGNPPYTLPLGMIIAVVFPVSVAYRLARFNVGHMPDSFVGLPSSVGGGIVALLAIYHGSGEGLIDSKLAIALYLALALLMASYIKYIKPQSAIRFRFHPLKSILLTLIIISLFVWFKWMAALFVVGILYVFSGIMAFILVNLQKLRFNGSVEK